MCSSFSLFLFSQTQPVLTPGMSLWFCVSEAPATIPKSGGRAINQQYFPGHSPTHPERVTWPCTNPRHRNGRGTRGPLLCRSRTEHTAARRAGGMRWGPHSPRRLARLCSTLSPPRMGCYRRGSLCPSFCLSVSFQCVSACRKGADISVLPL